MNFKYLLLIAALGMAACGACFSIIGISTLFSGAVISAGIMAGIIEFSKIIGTTFLYRYWKKSMGFLKFYMIVAVIILMLITSVGIFGFLLSAYQRSSIEFKVNQEKIVMIEGKKVYLNDKISQSKIRVQTLNDMRKVQENRLSETLTNAFLTRNPIQLKEIQDQTVDMVKSADESIRTEQVKIESTTDEIQKIDQQVNDMKFMSAGKKDIRTFQFVADQFGTTLDNVAKWFICTIVFVFDPLAVALILAYNIVVYKEDEIVISPEPIKEPVVNAKPEELPTVNSPVPIIDPAVKDTIPVNSEVKQHRLPWM